MQNMDDPSLDDSAMVVLSLEKKHPQHNHPFSYRVTSTSIDGDKTVHHLPENMLRAL